MSRVGETKLLLHKIMHEKAKLLLMRVKRQRLLVCLTYLSSFSVSPSSFISQFTFCAGKITAVKLGHSEISNVENELFA